MTSTANQQPANPASNNTAASYASAAGAVKKLSSTPVVATGSNPPIVAAGSSAPTSHHAKSSSISPMNGRPNIMPAVPTGVPNAPAVAHGTSTVNGHAEHNRKSSVTMSANGPNSYSANGGSAGAKSGIQFGYQDSPSVSHSTPQPLSAPIPIPGTSSRGVTEPRNSPSPIPLPSASGGRPPSGAAPSSATLNFGSFDNDRSHMRTPSTSQDPSGLGPQHSPHVRRGSNVSEISNHTGPQPGGMGRGNFSGAVRGGRGFGGGFNPSMGYPPNNYNRGQQGNQGRGGMPPNFAGNGRSSHHFGTPPPQNRSPAMSAAIPQQPPNMVPGTMPPFYYAQPPLGPNQQNFYPPQYGPGGTVPMQTYPMYPIMHGQGQSPVPHFQQPYTPGPYNPPGPQPMSRSNSSQVSEHRPASSTGQTQAPITQGTPQQQAAQLKPAVVSSPHFTRPQKKSAAIIIKNEAGEPLDVKNLKPPASPAPTIQQSRTPPVVSSTPTPPPKASTPKSFVSAHSRTDSTSNSKTAEEKRNEFMEKIKQTATSDKPKEDDTTKAMSDKSTNEEQPASEAVIQDEAKAADESKVEKEEKKEAEDEAAGAAVPDAQATKTSDEPDDEELERIIREMEEADAKREKEEEERRIKAEAEKAAKKKAEDESRALNAAENDRKLREQEREMERLEDEKARKRAAAEAGATASPADGKKTGDSRDVDSKDESPSASEATTKLANLSLTDKSSSVPSAKPTPGGRAPKPQALNLAPLSTKSVEAPQPSAALQSLRTARLLDVIKADIYPPGINSPNPALNAVVTKKGTSFKYDPAFLMQFKTVFTDQPSLDFHQQVKSLIGEGDGGRSASTRSAGGSGRQNTRSGTPSFPMGSFGAGGTHQLPPGTTSAQRFEMSNKSMSGRPAINPMASFQRPGGAFAGGSQMSRNSSSNMGSMPHSPRQGSSRRNPSKQNTVNAKVEAQAAKTMPLTQGMKIEALQTSTTGWKPPSISKAPTASNLANQSGLMEPAMVQRKVKAALNKMTPENFEKISDQILEIAAQSKEETDGRTLRQVIQLTFEKATDEAHWASMYAKFCKKMLETMSPEIRDENIKDRLGNVVNGGALFRKYLLNRCQEEFERGWKIQLPDEPKEGEDQKKSLEATMLSEEYYKAAAAKRRGLGLVQFIGELYKLGMLTERIMHECVRKLVDYSGIPDEAEVESLSKLLRTIGGNLDAAEKGKPMMDAYFQRIQSMIDLPGLPSRLQFMLMDVVDLRKANWVSKEANKGPKTLEEVRAEAEAAAAQKAAEAARGNQRGGGGRSQLGRGDVRNLPGGFPQPTPNQVGIDDLRRLKGGASRPSSTNFTLGPMSMLGSRSNSGRRLGPGGSLSRGADDSGASSRTGTPPVRDTQSSTNSFGLLANMDSDHPGSPPSAAASPALAKATLETSAKLEKDGN